MISIFHLSDIHYGHPILGAGNNQKLVLNKFIEDIKEQISLKNNNAIIVISGDLVYSATDNNYEVFYQNFICPLLEFGIEPHNIIVAPGNHDICPNTIDLSEQALINVCLHSTNETKINEMIKELTRHSKFECFKKFCNNKLSYQLEEVSGYQLFPNQDLEIFCLNTALCHTGGKAKELDKEKQHIYSPKLFDWWNKGSDKLKILVMHHPLTSLSGTASNIIKSLNIPIVLTGHIHDQDLFSRRNDNSSLYIQAPQLFSDKTDTLGYSIINIENKQVLNIEYRQWINRHNKFLNGIVFSGTNDGIININQQKKQAILPENRTNYDFNTLKKEFEKVTVQENNHLYIIELINHLKEIAIDLNEYREEIFNLFISHIRKRTKYTCQEKRKLEIQWLKADEKQRLQTVTYDIQLIFHILFNECSKIFSNYKADFSCTILSNIYMVNLQIFNANFSNAFLQHATMYSSPGQNIYSKFIDCNFNGAYMDAAHMAESDFTGSTFVNTKLRWGNLFKCNLKNATFTLTDMRCSILSECEMNNTFFKYCNIDGSELAKIRFLGQTIFFRTSLCLISYFYNDENEGYNNLVKYEECATSGMQRDTKYYEFGRIKRLKEYYKLIHNGFITEDKEYLDNKCQQLLYMIKKYCISNNTNGEKKEIESFLDE